MTVEVRVDGQRLTSFQRGSLQLSLGELASSFEVQYAVTGRQGAGRALVPGDQVEVWVDGALVIGGYVDTIDDEDGPTALRLSAAGRSKAMDLVDCSAEHKSFANQTVDQIAQALANPFGVKVRADGDMGEPFPRFSVQKGETVADAIMRGANLRGLYAFSVGADVVIARPAGGTEVARLVRGRAPLIQTARSDSWYSRYSHYVFKGQVPSTDDAHGKAASQLTSAVDDPGITRYRPLLVQVAGHGQGDLATRAAVVRNQRAGQSQTVALLLAGFSDAAGPWLPNRLVAIDNPAVGLTPSDVLVVSTVRMRFGDAQADETELTVVPPSAFDTGKYKALKTRSKWWQA